MAVHQAIMSRFQRLPVVVTVDVKLHQIIISIVYVARDILDHFVSTVSFPICEIKLCKRQNFVFKVTTN